MSIDQVETKACVKAALYRLVKPVLSGSIFFMLGLINRVKLDTTHLKQERQSRREEKGSRW